MSLLSPAYTHSSAVNVSFWQTIVLTALKLDGLRDESLSLLHSLFGVNLSQKHLLDEFLWILLKGQLRLFIGKFLLHVKIVLWQVLYALGRVGVTVRELLKHLVAACFCNINHALLWTQLWSWVFSTWVLFTSRNLWQLWKFVWFTASFHVRGCRKCLRRVSIGRGNLLFALSCCTVLSLSFKLYQLLINFLLRTSFF